MPTFWDIFTEEATLAYNRQRQYPAYQGSALMPSIKQGSTSLKRAVAGRKVPILAKVHALDTESAIISRESAAEILNLSLFKQKIQVTEEMIQHINAPRSAEEQQYLINEVFNDVERTRNGVLAGIEKVRMDAITKGAFALALEGGKTLSVDYQVPNANKRVLPAGADFSDPDFDILGLLDEVQTTLGIRLPYAITSRELLNDILSNNGIRDTMFRTTNLNVRPSISELNALFADRNLPQIAVMDQYYRDDVGSSPKRYFDKNYFVMVPEQQLGQTIFGPTPEESRLRNRRPDIQFTEQDYVLSMIYDESVDPVSTWTKSVAMAMPSLDFAQEMVQIKAGNRV